MSMQEQFAQLQSKRVKFRTAGLICGFGALTVGFWGSAVANVIGGLIFFLWLSLLICGFVFRSVAVSAREEAKFIQMQLAAQGLATDLTPLAQKPVVDPSITGAAWNTAANPQAAQAAAAPAAAASTPAPSAPAASGAPAAAEPTIESRLAKARRTKN